MNLKPHHLRPESSPARVGVAHRDGQYRAVALEAVEAGQVLLEIDGVFVDRPSRYSLQVDRDRHVAPPPGISQDDDYERYRWRYLNHSCLPNAAFEGRRLVAARDIGQWEEITFDYNSTEWEMACPFACHCGHCGGQLIRGFAHLSAEDQRRRQPFLAGHLRARLAAGA